MTTQPDARPALNDDHLPFLARLIKVAEDAGVAVVYCCFNNDWGIMTRPELDDAAGAAFLTALDVGEVGDPEQRASRTIMAGPEFGGGVRLFVQTLAAAPQIRSVDTPDGVRHYDDTGRECRAVYVDGELTYQPIEE